MKLDLKQSFKLTQQILMTPQLQQAIKLLQLSRIEVEDFIKQQMTENPVLEEDTNSDSDMKFKEKTHEEFMSEEIQKKTSELVENIDSDNKQIDWELLSRFKDTSNYKSKGSDDEEYSGYENLSEKNKTIQDHLLWQLNETNFSDLEKEIANKIIGNINDKGYLEIDLEEFCKQEDLNLEIVDGVLDSIQRLDPMGVGARDLGECLLIQLRELKLKNGVVEKIVAHHLQDIESRNYQNIAKKLEISQEEVIKNIGVIAGLNPNPGRQFGEDNTYVIIPDVYVFKVGEKWVVTLNEDNMPKLRLSDYYREIAKDFTKNSEKEYLSDRIKSAQWLIKSIQQRQRTILRVSESIVAKQLSFFEKGTHFLKPMILKNVAEDVELHESTISRATSNKYMHTPRGIFELKYFFNASLSGREGEGVASESVKTMIKELIDNEGQKKPLSDQKIVEIFEKNGIIVARRTVAKYREQLGISPSNRRKKLF